MQIETTVPDESAEPLSQQAKEELSSLVKEHTIELLNEAGRLEQQAEAGLVALRSHVPISRMLPCC
jgi:hypothetical protein